MLARALASVSAQTYADWNAIIVNDGGDAESVEALLRSLPPEHRSRIRAHHNSSPTGRWPAANLGVISTTSELLVLHDDDDSWDPHFLEVTVAYLDEHPDDVGVIARTEVILEAADERGQYKETGRYVLEGHHEEVLATDLLKFNRFVPIGFLYRRSLHDRIGLYDEELPAAADWAFNMAAFAISPIRYAGRQVLAYWHQRPGVDGVSGNSVFASADHHSVANRIHRDKELRRFIEAAGWGLPLYLRTEFEKSEKRADRLEEGLRAVAQQSREEMAVLEQRISELQAGIAALQYHLSRTIDTRVRGWVWRQKQRLRSGRRR